MKELVRVAGRSSPDARCAFCHDGLDGPLVSCPACQTAFHRDCATHLARCPTMGCSGEIRSAGAAVPERASPRSEILTAYALERLPRTALLVGAVVGLGLLLPGPLAERGALGWALLAAFAVLALATLADLVRSSRALRGLDAVLAEAPMPRAATVRVVRDDHGERHFLDLAASEGVPAITVELAAAPPEWVLARRVLVRGASGSGPLVLSSTRGDHYAVPRRASR